MLEIVDLVVISSFCYAKAVDACTVPQLSTPYTTKSRLICRIDQSNQLHAGRLRIHFRTQSPEEEAEAHSRTINTLVH